MQLDQAEDSKDYISNIGFDQKNLNLNKEVKSIVFQQPLRNHVQTAINNYFIELGEALPVNFYKFVLSEIEPPLLEATLRIARGNQTKAAKILGLSRGTLRKKLKQYALD